MSLSGQSAAPDLSEGRPVSSLTVVVLLLIPCVVILLLLNCLFLVYKLLLASRRSRSLRDGTPEILLHRRARSSLSEQPQHPVTSSRASSRAGDHGVRLTASNGVGTVRALSTIRASSTAGRLSLRPEPPSGLDPAGWCRSGPTLLQSTDSEAEVRVNLVPPNTPMNPLTLHQDSGHIELIDNSSDYEVLPDVSPDVAVDVFDSPEKEPEYTNPLSLTSWLNTSTVGPGLDSDFGASAGVSLRILSADSDGWSNGVLTSALEWDYYDPCYVKQNHLPKHQHHRPALHTKHYWV